MEMVIKEKLEKLILDKMDFETKIKALCNDKGVKEKTTFVNAYAPDIGVPKYIKTKITHKGRSRQQYNNSRGFQ